MGTRADFYVGAGKGAEWLGSCAYDGDSGSLMRLVEAQSEREFRGLVERRVEESDGTTPDQGWPWPWKDSRTTDFAYAWTEDGVLVWCFGRPIDPRNPDDDDREKEDAFPDMTERQNVTLGKRSGLIIIGPEGIVEGEP